MEQTMNIMPFATNDHPLGSLWQDFVYFTSVGILGGVIVLEAAYGFVSLLFALHILQFAR